MSNQLIQNSNDQKEKSKKAKVIIITLALLWLLFSGIAGVLWVKNNDINASKAKIESEVKKLDIEIEDMNKKLVSKDSQLTTKEHEITELSDKLKQTQARIAYLEQSKYAEQSKINEFKEKSKDVESKILLALEENEKLKSDLEVSKVENKSLNEKIKSLQSENEKQKSDLDLAKKEIDKLNSTIDNIYNAYDFKFFNVKNETGVAFKKGKVKKTFIVSFKVTKYDHKLATKIPEDMVFEIHGVSKKNGSYHKSDKIKDFSGGEVRLKFVNESFESGIYHLAVKQKNVVIGDANFMVR